MKFNPHMYPWNQNGEWSMGRAPWLDEEERTRDAEYWMPNGSVSLNEYTASEVEYFSRPLPNGDIRHYVIVTVRRADHRRSSNHIVIDRMRMHASAP